MLIFLVYSQEDVNLSNTENKNRSSIFAFVAGV